MSRLLQGGNFRVRGRGPNAPLPELRSRDWMKEGESPPVSLIPCAGKGAAEARYALDNLPNKVLAGISDGAAE